MRTSRRTLENAQSAAKPMPIIRGFYDRTCLKPIRRAFEVNKARCIRQPTLNSVNALLPGRDLKDKDASLTDAKRDVDRLSAELKQLRTQNSTLVASRAHDQSAISELKNQVQTLEGSNANSVAAMVELQDKIHSLNAAMEQQSAKLTMERQLTSVSSDVRQLMGARNLHIIDVHDVNGYGKSAKSFGRVC